jgi:hypothetical protein
VRGLLEPDGVGLVKGTTATTVVHDSTMIEQGHEPRALVSRWIGCKGVGHREQFDA